MLSLFMGHILLFVICLNLVCYVLMNIAVFAFLNITESNALGMKIDDFKGLYKKNQGLVIAYTLAIIGLAGFPITSGFIAKIYLFSAIAHSGLVFIPFLIILLVLTVIALYYYLKIILPLFEQKEEVKCYQRTKSALLYIYKILKILEEF